MSKQTKIVLALALLITLVSAVTWQLTGGDYYTKFEVIEEIRTPLDPNDPLAGTGFYEGRMPKKTVVHHEFRLGLLPTPNRLFDKHIFAVATIVSPVWVIALGLWWLQRRQSLAGKRQGTYRNSHKAEE